jgi:hypothetical protein
MYRFTMAGLAFPMQTRNVHPYFGGGLLFNQIASASLQSSTVTSARYQSRSTASSRRRRRSRRSSSAAPVRFRPLSAFGRVTVSPIQQSFFLANPNSSRSFDFALEFGVRYNVGSSIDRAR